MFGSRRTAHGRHALLALGATLVLALAACGGSATSPPTSGPDGSVGPGDTTGPGDTAGPDDTGGPAGSPADGSAAFNAATTALDALDSYTYSVNIESVDTASGTSHQRLSGTVVNTDEARLMMQEELDPTGTVTSTSSILIIGDEAWTRQGDDDPWTSIPAAQAQIFIQSFAAFRPEQMFGIYFAGFGGNFAEVGSETKNGVETTHYEGDESLGAILGSIVGVQGTWSSDAWIAKDGGHLVRSEASVGGESGGTGGSFSIVVDITDINSADALEPPE